MDPQVKDFVLELVSYLEGQLALFDAVSRSFLVILLLQDCFYNFRKEFASDCHVAPPVAAQIFKV